MSMHQRFNWLNYYHFDDDDKLSPADKAFLIQWLDGYNDDGTWSDKIVPRLDSPESVDVGVLAFDGTKIITLPSTSGVITDFNNFVISFWYEPDPSILSGSDSIVSRYTTTGNQREWRVVYDASNQRMTMTTSSDGINLTGTLSMTAGTLLRGADFSLVEIIRESGVSTVRINGLPVTTSADSLSEIYQGTGLFNIGGFNDTITELHGSLSGVKINDCCNYPMVNQLPYDVSGNGNHATTSTATVSTADGLPDWFTLKGLTFDTPDYLPALTDKTTGAITITDVALDYLGVVGLLPTDEVTGDHAVLGADVVVNGVFATDTDWTKGSGWTISGGSANGTANGTLGQPLTALAGEVWVIKYDITQYSSGSVRAGLGANVGTANTSVGSYLDVIAVVANTVTINFNQFAQPFSGSLDNITAEKVISGTVPYATTDAIKFLNAGTAYGWLNINGVPEINLDAIVGKTDATIPTVNYGTATVQTGAAGLEGFYSVRIANSAGVRVDARDYELIGVVGSEDRPLWYNGSPAKLRATDPYYFLVGNYPSFWVDAGGVAIDRTSAEIDAWISYTYNMWIQWAVDSVGTAGRCLGIELLQYPIDYAFDEAGHAQTKKYVEKYTDTCGGGVAPFWVGLTDDVGNLLVDDAGNELGYYV